MNRRIGLDLLKIFSALMVFLFHTNVHLGCQYGIFTKFINMSAIFMTTFFMISGWVLYKTYITIDLSKIKNIKTFYWKRMISIIPLYYVISFMYIVFLGDESFKANVILAPIEALGLQSLFSSLFYISHNGGTWFVSCLLFCYFFYPFIQELIKQLSKKEKCFVTILLMFVSIYSPFVVKYFNLQSIYSNPILRGVEFVIGILLSSFINMDSKNKRKLSLSLIMFICEIVVLIFGVTYNVNCSIEVANYMYYNYMIVPISIIMIFTLSEIIIKNEKVINCIYYCSSLAYSFFLAQFFTWDITRYLINILAINNNVGCIIVSFCVCIIISVILHELIERPIKKYLVQKVL